MTIIGQLRNGVCVLQSFEMVNFGEEYEVTCGELCMLGPQYAPV